MLLSDLIKIIVQYVFPAINTPNQLTQALAAPPRSIYGPERLHILWPTG